jgi:hypothetical protein
LGVVQQFLCLGGLAGEENKEEQDRNRGKNDSQGRE